MTLFNGRTVAATTPSERKYENLYHKLYHNITKSIKGGITAADKKSTKNMQKEIDDLIKADIKVTVNGYNFMSKQARRLIRENPDYMKSYTANDNNELIRVDYYCYKENK